MQKYDHRTDLNWYLDSDSLNVRYNLPNINTYKVIVDIAKNIFVNTINQYSLVWNTSIPVAK